MSAVVISICLCVRSFKVSAQLLSLEGLGLESLQEMNDKSQETQRVYCFPDFGKMSIQDL